MRVLVCGGRDFWDRDAISRAMMPYRPQPVTEPSEHILIVGGATGADALAEEWADVWGMRKRVFPANWARDGRAAGPIRNQRMIDEGKPDLVIAFPGGRGTADMVRRAKAAGIEVREM
jgi:UDP-N-acetylmuramoylalanine-D-glutamate ligase